MHKISSSFFARDSELVARELLGKVLVRTFDGKQLLFRIVETEAYYGSEDPASRAYKGKNKVSEVMWGLPGTIMVYFVHNYIMFNIVTGKEGEPSAVLIRALEPLNNNLRCKGPGLLTRSLNITRDLNGTHIDYFPEIEFHDDGFLRDIETSFRMGVSKDLKNHLRFFIKGNSFVSR